MTHKDHIKNSRGNGEISDRASCIFCKIVKKEIPAEIIYEDDISISFLDINPVNEGHLLVIPKEHHPYMTETPDPLLGNLFSTTKKLMSVVKRGTDAEFVTVSVVGTDIPHLHIHIIPRHKNDGLAGFWPTKKYENIERMKEVAEKIKNVLRSAEN